MFLWSVSSSAGLLETAVNGFRQNNEMAGRNDFDRDPDSLMDS